jgi:hypothetical protein
MLALTLCAGCTDVASLAATMNDRQIQSCLYLMGSYGPFVGVRVVSATGGASLKECLRD